MDRLDGHVSQGDARGDDREPLTRAVLRPWSRQPGESPKAHEAFAVYLGMGPDRSLTAVARQLGKHKSLIKRWSARHRWRQRAAAYDEHEQQREEREAHAAQEAAYRRRVLNAEQLERVAMAGLRSLLVQDPETGETRFDRRLKPVEIAALIRVACWLLPTAPVDRSQDRDDPGHEALGRLSQGDVDLVISMLERDLSQEESDDGDAQQP